MRGVLLTALTLAAACNGPCEKVCVNLSEYAQECGFTVADSEVDACIDAQAAATSEEKAVCRDFGAPDVIRSEWTCDDLQAYWEGGAEE